MKVDSVSITKVNEYIVNVRHMIRENNLPHECMANADKTGILLSELSDYTITEKELRMWQSETTDSGKTR